MEEITSRAVPFHRSHYYSFQGHVWDLPDGQKAHIYVKPTYNAGPFNETEINVYVIIGTIDGLGAKQEPIAGIRGHIEINSEIEHVYRLDCEYDEDGEVLDYLIGTYNGLVDELDTFWANPPVDEVCALFEKWGLGYVGYEV